MSFTKTQLAIIAIGLVVLIGVAALFIYGNKNDSGQLSGNITFWGVFDTVGVMNEIIGSYNASQPGVSITYKQINPATYESDLINALASGDGPDVIMFHSTWLPKHFTKIAPFSGTQIGMQQYRELFPTVVEQDFAPDGVIYGFPMYIDTLATFYNQDIFDNKGIAVPPKTWDEFEKLVPKLRTLDKLGRVQKAAVALGGSSKSINRMPDILGLLMLQSGTKMVGDSFTYASFNSDQGLNALNFYTKFTNPISPVYTWNDSLAYSLDNFAAGDTAVMFNYAYQSAYLKEKNPFLNFRVIPMMQPDKRERDVNFANYWGLAASRKSKNLAAAQDFIMKITTDPVIAQKYLQRTGRPPALRSLINAYLNDPAIGVFASQALTARSWPQIDNLEVDKSFSDMITAILTNKLTAKKALDEAVGTISKLMERRTK